MRLGESTRLQHCHRQPGSVYEQQSGDGGEVPISIAIIGSGVGGLDMAHALKQAGLGHFAMFEKAQDLGGVWGDNVYPGAACDVASHLYSFAFEPHYLWSRGYRPPQEIHAYLAHVGDKYGLRRHIRFGREVLGAEFNEARGLWIIRFSDGSRHEARVLISAGGQLNRPKIPELPGLEKFCGHAFHSVRLDRGYESLGKTVAVIGTGPSAVQFVSAIAPLVKQLHVYQRSTTWTLAKFDGSYSRLERWLLTSLPFLHTLDRWRIYWWFESLSSALQNSSKLGRVSRAVLRIAATTLMNRQVKDPALRAKLTPDSPGGLHAHPVVQRVAAGARAAERAAYFRSPARGDPDGSAHGRWPAARSRCPDLRHWLCVHPVPRAHGFPWPRRVLAAPAPGLGGRQPEAESV